MALILRNCVISSSYSFRYCAIIEYNRHKLPIVHPKTKKLLLDLKAWCDEPGGYGRRVEVAKLLGVATSSVTDWFAGRRCPSLDHGFIIQDFLKKHARRRKAG
jgi:Helix-turn-helix